MYKYFKYILLVFFTAAIALGLYQWQFHSPNLDFLPKQESSKDSLEDYYNLNSGKTPPSEVTFLAVGDIMLSRDVASRMDQAGKDGFLPFRGMDEILSSTDFNFGNLESPFSGSDNYTVDERLIFNAPTWTMSGLAQYNFKVLNLANNHALNQGKAGLIYTKNYLDARGLQGLGTGANLDEAWQGTVYETKGIKIGFIGASYFSMDSTGGYIANIKDTERLQKSIANMKTRADLVVVTMHAGIEYEREPTQQQIDFAHAAVDYGADIVIGAHPHWIQPKELYKGKQIFYSLGNFIFDQGWSQDTKEGLTLKITLTKTHGCTSAQKQVACMDDLQGSRVPATIKQIEMIPIIIENNSTPRPATDTEKASIFKKIGVTNPIVTP